MAEKPEITKEFYLRLIQKVFENKLEERELALDRNRKADEQMETAEQFILMGKNAVSFLNQASLSTSDLAALAKEIKGIVYKEEIGGDINLNLSDSWKDAIVERVDEVERVRKPLRSTDVDNEEK
jgi:hypothetical protein